MIQKKILFLYLLFKYLIIPPPIRAFPSVKLELFIVKLIKESKYPNPFKLYY